LSDEDQRQMLTEVYEELYRLMLDMKRISNSCKTVIDIRLHRVSKAMNHMGEIDNTYSNEDGRNNNSKGFMLSKKI
ncbi:MAG: hypothetical protein ACERLG_07150, partial [Sedimentibacter sp.]